MQAHSRPWLSLFLTLFAGTASASDACSTHAVLTSADVTVSDGTAFATRSFFHSREGAAIQHIGEKDRIVAVEGPFGWTRDGGNAEIGADFHKLFALGHQFHAFLLYFDELTTNPRNTEHLPFQGSDYRASSADYLYGGTVHLVESTEGEHPAGLVFDFPDRTPIQVSFSDWQTIDGVDLPLVAEIDDGERIFEYRYTRIEIAPRSPLWFQDAVSAPELDEILLYRLHRSLLAAHCLGDADMLANLSAGEVLSANRGQLAHNSRDAIRERFTSVFERIDYTEYHDIATPLVDVAESQDLGWLGVSVRAVGSDKDSGTPFDDQWAWIMIARKIDGRWLHVANASNAAR